MAKNDSTETRVIKVTSTDKYEDFVAGCKRVCLVADADCFVDFNRPAIANSSFLLKANVNVTIPNIEFTQVHAVTASGTANLYILAIR